MRDLISVIMSTYNEPLKWIEQAIDSILGQTYQNIEFIIIVDAPENKELINYITERKKQDNRIIIHINGINMGLTASLNMAISLANGLYIARMDADDIAEPDRIECQIEYLVSCKLDLVGCNVMDINEEGKILNIKGTNLPTSDKAIKDYLRTNGAIMHPTWLVKKSVYIEMGMYHDFPACEDYDFLTRVALAGYKLGNVREVKQMYRINTKGISNARKVMQKSSHYFIMQNYNCGKQSNLDEFYRFIESDMGKKKQEGLRNYYNASAKLKRYYHDKEYITFLIVGLKTFVKEKEGRVVAANILRKKWLRLKYGKYY
ncbi:MAG: glycosyltransferase [Roseburia sp.]|nr:glycosyltransferase [Roseburia sp.]